MTKKRLIFDLGMMFLASVLLTLIVAMLAPGHSHFPHGSLDTAEPIVFGNNQAHNHDHQQNTQKGHEHNSSGDGQKPVVKFGVLAHQSKHDAHQQWDPLAQYLEEKIQTHHFEIVPLNYDEINAYVKSANVDFVIANPSICIELEHQFDAQRILTLAQESDGEISTRYASVIFTLKKNKGLKTLGDLKSKRIAAVNKRSLGGWQMASYAFNRLGIDPEGDFAQINYTNSHQRVVDLVTQEQADAGIVRSGTFEELAKAKKIDLDDYYFFPKFDAPRQIGTTGVIQDSTQSYPQWSLLRLRPCCDLLSDAIVRQLINYQHTDPQTQKSTTWITPRDYSQVHETLMEQGLTPYQGYGEITFGQIHAQYWYVIYPVGFLLIGLTGVILRFRGLISNFHALEKQFKQNNMELAEGIIREQEATIELQITLSKLKIAKEKAEVSSKSKSEFLANMSHEIRTPMTAILGFTDILYEAQNFEDVKPEVLNAIKTIKRNGQYLIGIINDILDLSKVEAGKMTTEKIETNLFQIVQDVEALMKVKAEEKAIKFNVEYVNAMPPTIETDPTRLRQILINVIGNAIKFTNEGGVRLITQFNDHHKKPLLQLDILDTGIGMTQQQIDKLFQPFTQADSSTTRNFGGTGLGLTISKHFCKMLGGDIQVVDSNPETGTRFRITIETGEVNPATFIRDPMNYSLSKQSEASLGKPVSNTPLENTKILLVEDGQDNQRLISHILKKAGAVVTVKENGKLGLDAALEAAQAGQAFDVIFMDMQMPVMDGYTAAGHLRDSNCPSPVIALTAHAMSSDRQKCLDAGCDDYATKPVDRKDLIAKAVKYAFGDDTGEMKRAA